MKHCLLKAIVGEGIIGVTLCAMRSGIGLDESPECALSPGDSASLVEHLDHQPCSVPWVHLAVRGQIWNFEKSQHSGYACEMTLI